MDSVSLFRVVQRDELADLRRSRRFATVATSLDVKWFWNTREDAERFARLLARQEIEPSWIVEVGVHHETIQRLSAGHPDGRPARFVEERDLGWFNDVVLRMGIPHGDDFVGSDG